MRTPKVTIQVLTSEKASSETVCMDYRYQKSKVLTVGQWIGFHKTRKILFFCINK